MEHLTAAQKRAREAREAAKAAEAEKANEEAKEAEAKEAEAKEAGGVFVDDDDDDDDVDVDAEEQRFNKHETARSSWFFVCFWVVRQSLTLTKAEAEAAKVEEGEGVEQQTTEVAASPVKAKAKARSKKEVKPISKEELEEKAGKKLWKGLLGSWFWMQVCLYWNGMIEWFLQKNWARWNWKV